MVAEMGEGTLDRTENIVEKEVKPGFQHFLLFPQCHLKVIF